MKANELKAKDPVELHQLLQELLKVQFSLRMRKAMQQLSDTSQIRKVRRTIARLRTILSYKKKHMG